MTNLLRVFAVSLLLMLASHEMSGTPKSPLPPQGIIPDEVTAVKIAEPQTRTPNPNPKPRTANPNRKPEPQTRGQTGRFPRILLQSKSSLL